MGVLTEFLYTTGNARLFLKSFKEKEYEGMFAYRLQSKLKKMMVYRDDNGEEYTTLEEMGKVLDSSLLVGYLNDHYQIGSVYIVYQHMSINGGECCKCDWKKDLENENVVEVKSKVCFDELNGMRMLLSHQSEYTSKEKKEYLNSLRSMFGMSNYLPNIEREKNEKFSDIEIVTCCSAIENYSNLITNYTLEPCRIYFKHIWSLIYLEFLPNGQGIIYGDCETIGDLMDLPYFFDYQELFYTLKPESLSWKTKHLYNGSI